MRVVTWTNDELATDALPVHGFEHYKAKDYSLAHAPFSGTFALHIHQHQNQHCQLQTSWCQQALHIMIFNLLHSSMNTFGSLSVGSSYAGGQWAAGDEPLYYIVSPKDVVIAKPR